MTAMFPTIDLRTDLLEVRKLVDELARIIAEESTQEHLEASDARDDANRVLVQLWSRLLYLEGDAEALDAEIRRLSEFGDIDG